MAPQPKRAESSGGLPPALVRRGVRLVGKYVIDAGLPIERQRARMQRLDGFAPPPKGVDLVVRTVGGVEVEEIVAAGTQPDRTVLHLHGGGYVVGGPASSRGWGCAVALGIAVRVLAPNYRLAPEHPFPAALDDAAAVWKELTATTDPTSIVLSGDSAGGGLALALAARLCSEGSPLPAGLVLISPWLDLTADRRADVGLVSVDPLLSPAWLEQAAAAYAAGTDRSDPGVSPLLGDLSGLPPLLVQAGTDDVLVPDSLRLARAVRAAGGDITLSIANDLWHDFPLQAGLIAPADGAVRQAAAFIDRVTAPSL